MVSLKPLVVYQAPPRTVTVAVSAICWLAKFCTTELA